MSFPSGHVSMPEVTQKQPGFGLGSFESSHSVRERHLSPGLFSIEQQLGSWDARAELEFDVSGAVTSGMQRPHWTIIVPCVSLIK